MDQSITPTPREPLLAEVVERYAYLQQCFGGLPWKQLTTAQKEAIVENAYADDPLYWDQKWAADAA